MLTKVQNFYLPLLVNCIWCTVMFYILECWPQLCSEPAGILHYVGSPFPHASRGSIDNFQSAAEGATITYSCSPGLVPRSQMSAVCTNMTWRPDPATLQCREPFPGELGRCIIMIFIRVCPRWSIACGRVPCTRLGLELFRMTIILMETNKTVLHN